jgi:hypothetical protein
MAKEVWRKHDVKPSRTFVALFALVCAALTVTTVSADFPAGKNFSHEVGFRLDPVKKKVEDRWTTFQEGKEFAPFEAGRPEAALKREFQRLHSVREKLWTTSDYVPAEHLVAGDLIRAPGCGAFAYNSTALNYNASTIYINGRPYVACEGPRSKDIPAFFDLLNSLGVTHLVRLTDSYEGETKKCHPYWEGLLSEEKDRLDIPTKDGVCSVRAYDMAYWRDHQGVDPDKLLDLVLQVRDELAETDALLAVHCSAGVGRTGTFLASLAIVDAIDKGEPFSIEEIVYRLSLQRVHSVGKDSQYVTLHRLAEAYLGRKLLARSHRYGEDTGFYRNEIQAVTDSMRRRSLRVVHPK